MAWTENITFENDTMNARSKEAFAATHGYPATVPDPDPKKPAGSEIPNPMTKGQFRAQRIKEYIKEVVRNHETSQATKAAINQVNIPD